MSGIGDRFTGLCAKWHTPKVPIDNNPLAHNYGSAYGTLLTGRDIKKIVEIGCGYAGLFHQDYVAGGSLRLWADLYPQAGVFGIDNRADALLNDGRIRSFLCDQNDHIGMINLIQRFIGRGIGLVVDDGSHEPAHQVKAVALFLPYLAPDGIIIIEDVRDGETSKRLPWEHEVIECSGLPSVSDDRLIVVRAGARMDESGENWRTEEN